MGDRVDRYIRLVDKYVPKVSEEARVYMARFPHKVGKVLKQVRKIRKKIRKNRNKQRHRATLRPARLPTPGGATQTVPGGEQAGELVTTEQRGTPSHADEEQLNDTPPDWRGGSSEEEAQQPDTSSWPWGAAGRPSDRGESIGVLTEKRQEPAGEPLPRHRSLSGSPDDARGGVQLTPTQHGGVYSSSRPTWRKVVREECEATR